MKDLHTKLDIPTDTSSYLYMLIVSNPLRETMIESAIEILDLPSGSLGLDVGCGIGFQAINLAEAALELV